MGVKTILRIAYNNQKELKDGLCTTLIKETRGDGGVCVKEVLRTAYSNQKHMVDGWVGGSKSRFKDCSQQ